MATREELLETLTARFKSKEFLPTISDTRNFLEIHGKKAVPQRATNLKTVQLIISIMDTSELQRIVEDRLYGGPTRLGPLSAAIKNYRLT